jgi:hypothetical protein
MIMMQIIWNERGSVKTLVLAVIFIGLLTATIVQRANRSKLKQKELKAREAPIVEEFKKDEVYSIQILELLSKTELKKRDGKWWVGYTSIMPNMTLEAKESAEIAAWDLADDDAVQQLIDAVQNSLKNWEIVSTNKEKKTDFRIGPLGSEFRFKNEEGKDIICVNVGEKAADFTGTYVAKCNEDNIYKVPGILEYVFKRKPNDWRTKQITDLDKDKLVKIEILAGGASKPVTIEKDISGNWAGTSPAPFTPDKKRVDALLTSFSTYKAQGFPERLMSDTIETIELTLTGYLDNGEKWSLIFGSSQGAPDKLVKSDKNQILYQAGYQDIENLNLSVETLKTPPTEGENPQGEAPPQPQ